MRTAAAPPPSSGSPSLALIEVASIARGYVVADAMVKKAPVTLLQCAPVTPGKLIVLVGGAVAEVDEAFAAGLAAAGDRIIDKLFLAQAHEQLGAAIAGNPAAGRSAVDALGIVEMATVAAAVRAADAAAKAARVYIIEMRLGRGLGGKGFFILSGPLAEIEAAVLAASGAVDPCLLTATEIIGAPHADFTVTLATGGRL